jgi:D-glycero-alpha-D-manno-heptose-7-phosphate kinase
MEDSILVFFTGRTRSASAVLANQSAAMRTADRRVLMRRMVQLAFEMKEQLESGTLEHFGNLLDENWQLKAQLTSGITDPQIDAWYATGIAHGAVGGKLLGAGNGGFLMFYAPKERHVQIKNALSKLAPVKFRFDRTGAQIVFFQPSL